MKSFIVIIESEGRMGYCRDDSFLMTDKEGNTRIFSSEESAYNEAEKRYPERGLPLELKLDPTKYQKIRKSKS